MLCLITGFLGAGKTTLLRKQLAGNPSMPFSVFVNDFGDISIDAKLLELTMPFSKVVELSNGCVCCVLSKELSNQIRAHKRKFSHIKNIFIELSGLSHPEMVLKAVQDLDPQIEVLCVIDATQFLTLAKKEPLLLKQAGCADRFYLSKVEKCSKAEFNALLSFLKKLNPGASNNMKTSKDLFPPDWFFKKEQVKLSPFKAMPDFSSESFTHQNFSQWSKRWSGEVSIYWIQKLLQAFTYDYSGEVIRMKALLRVRSQVWSIHGVGDLYEKELICPVPRSERHSIQNEIVVFAYSHKIKHLISFLEKSTSEKSLQPDSKRLARFL